MPSIRSYSFQRWKLLIIRKEKNWADRFRVNGLLEIVSQYDRLFIGDFLKWFFKFSMFVLMCLSSQTFCIATLYNQAIFGLRKFQVSNCNLLSRIYIIINICNNKKIIVLSLRDHSWWNGCYSQILLLLFEWKAEIMMQHIQKKKSIHAYVGKQNKKKTPSYLPNLHTNSNT